MCIVLGERTVAVCSTFFSSSEGCSVAAADDMIPCDSLSPVGERGGEEEMEEEREEVSDLSE